MFKLKVKDKEFGICVQHFIGFLRGRARCRHRG